MEEIVAIYRRVSTQLQSNDRQKQELLRFAKDRGWNIPDERIYVDVISEFKAGEVRPEFSRLLCELKSNGITCILFSEFSRLARNATDLLQQINYFREPLPLIFEKLKNSNNIRASLLLEDMVLEIRNKPCNISAIWALKAKERYRSEPLKNEDVELIIYVGNFIGQTDYDNQMNKFTYLEDKLKERISDAQNELSKKGPIYKKIGFIIGIMISIVFL